MDLSNIDAAFTGRGFDLKRPRRAYLEVPFGHVVAASMPVADVVGENLPRFFSTGWAMLGPLAKKYSDEHRLNLGSGGIVGGGSGGDGGEPKEEDRESVRARVRARLRAGAGKRARTR